MVRRPVRAPFAHRPSTRRRGRPLPHRLLAILAALTLALSLGLAPEAATPSQAASNAVNILNAYRALANLGTVTEDATLSAGAVNHSIYMVKNQTGVHAEDPAKPFFTASGNQAGTNGNTFIMWPASSFTDQGAIDFWMSGAFHQLHLVDPMLLTIGYGTYLEATATANDIEAGATMDVLSAPKGPAGTKPLMFPGNNKVMPLREFKGNEFPDPFTTASCAGYTASFDAPSGPAITVQIASVPSVTAHSITRNGTAVEHCWFDETTYTNPDAGTQALGRQVMANALDGSATRHAIVLMPRQPLADGTYNVSITSNGTVYAWTFFVGTPPVQRTLTVSKNGTGSGTVTGTGISCGADCSESYTNGTGVTLTASAAAGSTFAGWSGACTGTTATCTLTMNADKTATATFNVIPPTQRTLTVSKNGTGSGTVTATGINCGADCSETYNDGTPVTLTASPAAGSVFAGWAGDCAGTATTCSLTMSANRSATATFNIIPPTQRTLTISKNGTGSGTVTSSPAGITCGADCSEVYNDGTPVTLTASAAAGSVFAGWSGACTGTNTTCTLTMNANKTATATFNTVTVQSFSATATTTQSTATPGGSVGITATATTPPAGTYVVDIEVHDANDHQMFQWYWENEPFTAGQTRTFSTTWPVPANLPPGTYTVQVGIFSGPDWVTEHLYNNNAAQISIAAAAVCSPRPKVQLALSRGQAGQLVVTASAGQGTLREIRFGAATNARITVAAGAGGRAGLTASPGNAALALTDRPAALTFTVARAAAGQTTTVPLVLVDDCGEWPTFVGGGPNGF